MSRTNRKYYKGFRSKYVSGRFSGYDGYKMKPYGLKGWNYYWRKDRDGRMSEDAYSEMDKTSYRMRLKNELKRELEETY